MTIEKCCDYCNALNRTYGPPVYCSKECKTKDANTKFGKFAAEFFRKLKEGQERGAFK